MANVLITGTSSGIGLATAVELARRGERVFASMPDTSRSGQLEEAAGAAGVSLEVVQLDVTDPASVTRAVGDVIAAGGRIDVLLNNAGIASLGPLEFTTDEQVEHLFDTNVFGPLRLIRAVLPAMRARGRGRIINVSTLAAHPRMGFRLWGAYTASKAALANLTLELCKEVAPLGIEVVLLDGGVGGRSSMQDSAGDTAAGFDPAASPYGVVERVAQQQLTRMTDRTNPSPEAPATLMADACTIEHPPLRFPPEAQALGDSSDRLSDERFLRLAALDPSPDLYEAPTFAWETNLGVAREGPFVVYRTPEP